MDSNQATDSSSSAATHCFLHKRSLRIWQMSHDRWSGRWASAQLRTHKVSMPDSDDDRERRPRLASVGPGGSVYDQQVPQPAGSQDVPTVVLPGAWFYRSRWPREAW